MKRSIIFSLTLLFITTAFCAIGTHAACTVFVTNTGDSSTPGSGSLRAAINAANVNPNLDTICFNIPGSGVQTIHRGPSGPGGFPSISQPVIIDGFSQPGSHADTAQNSHDAVMLIEIKGDLAGSLDSGLSIISGPGFNASGSTIMGLVINSFGSAQIAINGTSNNTIQGNFIGTNAAGTARVANLSGSTGIRITGGADNIIGGTSVGQGNLISGNGILNGGPGIFLNGNNGGNPNVCSGAPTPVSGTIIQGNLIGTDRTGSYAVANNTGVYIRCSASGNVVGGTIAGARNVISGNAIDPNNNLFGQGVLLGLGTTDNTIQGNYIGTDATGMAAVPNESFGISLGFGAPNSGSSHNLIGGPSPVAGNVISGNARSGVFIQQHSDGNIIQQNLIGVKANGIGALGNSGNGVGISSFSSGNLVGGTTDGQIGSPSAGNTIANNVNGVSVFSSASDTGPSTGNTIIQNSIFSNQRLGIDLNGDSIPPGVTPNDPCDSDNGSNNLQNFPVLTSLATSAGMATISGKLDSTPGNQFYLEFFSNAAEDPSGNGEGQTFIGSTILTTGGGCTANFTVNLAIPNNEQSITATASSFSTHDTSEFSAWFATSSTSVSSDIDPSTYGQLVTFTATVSSTAGTPSGSVIFMDGATVLGNGTLDGSGHAAFATSSLAAGSHSITAVYNGNTNYYLSTSAVLYQVVNAANTTTSLSSDQNPSADGQSVTFNATVTAVAPGAGTPTGTVTFSDGATVLATIPVDGTGHAAFVTSSLSNGPHSITATYNGSANFLGSGSTSVSQLVYGVVAGGGSFVIGNGNAAVGSNVTYWGAQWASMNTLSDGSAPSSFKGFADQAPAGCGGTWTTRPGNSSKPPDSIPGYMAVIVAGSASKSGSTISGNTTQIVIVKTNAGYDSNPGHAGTGAVVAVICH